MALAAAPALAQQRELKLDENNEWQTTRQPVEGTDEWIVARARQDLADDRPGAALSAIDAWIRAQEAQRSGSPSPYMADAILVRADATTASGDEYEALYDYERVIKEFPGTPAFTTAVDRELDIGTRYVNGLERKFFGIRMLDATDIGEELLIRVQERLPGSRTAERAGIELADYYYREHDLSLASEAYDLFTQNYRNSQYTMKAMQRRVYATIAQFKGPRYDGSKLLDAEILVKRFASLYPTQAREAGLDEALLARLDESAGLSMLESAKFYISRGDYPSARYTLTRLLDEHPQTAAAKTAFQTLEDRGWKPVPRRKPRVLPADREIEVPATNGVVAPAPGDSRPPPVEPRPAVKNPDARPSVAPAEPNPK